MTQGLVATVSDAFRVRPVQDRKSGRHVFFNRLF